MLKHINFNLFKMDKISKISDKLTKSYQKDFMDFTKIYILLQVYVFMFSMRSFKDKIGSMYLYSSVLS